MKQVWQLTLRLALSGGILALLFTQLDLQKLWIDLHRLSIPFVVFALIYYTGCQWLSCWRWQIIIRSTGYFVGMSNLLSGYFGCMFLNTFFPNALGDGYRAYKVVQKNQDWEAALVSVFLERATGLIALLALALLGLPPVFQIVQQWDLILIFSFCTSTLIGGVLLLVSPQLLHWSSPILNRLHLSHLLNRLAKIQSLLLKFGRDRSALAQSLLLSLLLQLLLVYYYYLVAQQLQIPISYLELLVFVPIIVFATLLPLPLGGLGFREGLLAYLFTRIHLAPEQAVVLSLTITVLGWILSLPGGLVVLADTTGWQAIKQKANSDKSETLP